jgi:hypothetical protein
LLRVGVRRSSGNATFATSCNRFELLAAWWTRVVAWELRSKRVKIYVCAKGNYLAMGTLPAGACTRLMQVAN